MDDRRYEWDEAKNRHNFAKHGLDFQAVEGFRWDEAAEKLDVSDDHEERWRAIARLADGKYAVLIYTEREARIRVISLRYAERKEIREYVEERDEEG